VTVNRWRCKIVIHSHARFAKIAPVTNPCARVGPHTASTVNSSRDAAKNLATCAKFLRAAAQDPDDLRNDNHHKPNDKYYKKFIHDDISTTGCFFQNCYHHNHGDYIILKQNSIQNFQN